MGKKKSYLTVTDQFCGAGGSSIGAERAGAELRIGLNHWKLALETHNANFPNADHDCVNVSRVNPRRYESTDILITSPECTSHTLAKGARRKALDQGDLFKDGRPDPAEERSRMTMNDVARFAEVHRYEMVVVENVVDIRYWSRWDAWLRSMHRLGYRHKEVYFNSMFAHPTPQSRDRVYVVFWREGRRAPDLEFAPRAHCPRCASDVDARQTWKSAGKMWGKYGRKMQYVYTCPACRREVAPYYYCAANVIDWAIPISRIGDRDRPLRERTIRRIGVGLEKYGREALLVSNFSPGWARPLCGPTGSITTRDHHALAVPPFILETKFSHALNDRTRELKAALATQSTQASQALIMPPFVVNMQSDNGATGMSDAFTTVLTGNHKYVAMPPWVVKFRNNAEAGRVGEALGTVSAGGVNHGVVVPPFLVKYYGTGVSSGMTDPAPTVMSRDRFGLVVTAFIYSYYTRLYGARAAVAGVSDALPVQPASSKHALVVADALGELPAVEDCYFRMLQPDEIHRAMAFPSGYVVFGNKRDRVRQYGNAVTPPVMEMILRQCIDTFK